MKRRGKFNLFVLTPEEQRTIAFVVLALVLGLWTRHYRSTHSSQHGLPNDLPAATTPAAPLVSPSPAKDRRDR